MASTSSARIKGKPAAGLHKIPESPEEWRESAVKHGLSARSLADLCQAGAFSASTVPTDALLTMRPVWVPWTSPDDAAEAISRTGVFFTPRQFRQAGRILEHNRLGMDKLDNLLDLICSSNAPRTPTRINDSLGEALGVFASLVSLDNRLRKEAALTPSLEETRPVQDAPVATRFRHAGETPPSFSWLDSPIHSSAGGLDRLSEALANLSLGDVGSSVQGSASASTHFLPSALGQPPVSSSGEVGNAGSGTSPSLPAPAPREPPETVVVDFLVNFMAALAMQVQPFTRKPVCVADAYERNYSFGPPPIPAPQGGQAATVASATASKHRAGTGARTAGKSALRPLPSFLARVDGGIPSCRRQDPWGFVANFEVKRAFRPSDDIRIRAQETMEHVAIIWDRHFGDQSRPPDSTTFPQKSHTLMISQDLTEIFFTVSTYTASYLDYLSSLLSPNPAHVIPPGPLRGVPLLSIEEFGPFRLQDKRHMRLVSQVVLSLLIWQMDGLEASRLIAAATKEDDDDDEGGEW